jgi:hypothetical protein
MQQGRPKEPMYMCDNYAVYEERCVGCLHNAPHYRMPSCDIECLAKCKKIKTIKEEKAWPIETYFVKA